MSDPGFDYITYKCVETWEYDELVARLKVGAKNVEEALTVCYEHMDDARDDEDTAYVDVLNDLKGDAEIALDIVNELLQSVEQNEDVSKQKLIFFIRGLNIETHLLMKRLESVPYLVHSKRMSLALEEREAALRDLSPFDRILWDIDRIIETIDNAIEAGKIKRLEISEELKDLHTAAERLRVSRDDDVMFQLEERSVQDAYARLVNKYRELTAVPNRNLVDLSDL